MPQLPNPHSRSIYPRELSGAMSKGRLEGELRKITKEFSAIAPNIDPINRVEVSTSDFAVLEHEIKGWTGSGSEISLTNPINNVKVIISQSTAVTSGNVIFWTQY